MKDNQTTVVENQNQKLVLKICIFGNREEFISCNFIDQLLKISNVSPSYQPQYVKGMTFSILSKQHQDIEINHLMFVMDSVNLDYPNGIFSFSTYDTQALNAIYLQNSHLIILPFLDKSSSFYRTVAVHDEIRKLHPSSLIIFLQLSEGNEINSTDLSKDEILNVLKTKRDFYPEAELILLPFLKNSKDPFFELFEVCKTKALDLLHN